MRQASGSVRSFANHAPILIDGPGNFTAINGVTGGDGSPRNPYTIQGWRIDASTAPGIEIRNVVTEDPVFFVIRNVFIHSDSNTHADILIDSFASLPTCWECPGNVYPGTIANSTLAGGAYGVLLRNGDNVGVSGVTIHDARTGVKVDNEDFSLTSNSLVTDARIGIDLSSSLNAAFNDTIVDSDTGILVANAASLDVINNTISAPQGISLQNSGPMFITNNKLTGASGPTVSLYRYGISLIQSDSINIESNLITNSLQSSTQSGAAGINITGSGNFVIVGNTIQAGDSHGIFLHNTYGSQNLLFHNNLLNNAVQAFDDTPTTNLWDNGYPSGGNFWSDFSGVDNCRGPQQNICPSPDGIGDTPYVFNFNQDHYPLMKPFTG